MAGMPIGYCIVCEEELDHSDAGFCATCGCAFCWGTCGGWGDDGHQCENCRPDETPPNK